MSQSHVDPMRTPGRLARLPLAAATAALSVPGAETAPSGALHTCQQQPSRRAQGRGNRCPRRDSLLVTPPTFASSSRATALAVTAARVGWQQSMSLRRSIQNVSITRNRPGRGCWVRAWIVSNAPAGSTA